MVFLLYCAAFVSLLIGLLSMRHNLIGEIRESRHEQFALISAFAAMYLVATAESYNATALDSAVMAGQFQFFGVTGMLAVMPWFIAELAHIRRYRAVVYTLSAMAALAGVVNYIVGGAIADPELGFSRDAILPTGEILHLFKGRPSSGSAILSFLSIANIIWATLCFQWGAGSGRNSASVFLLAFLAFGGLFAGSELVLLVDYTMSNNYAWILVLSAPLLWLSLNIALYFVLEKLRYERLFEIKLDENEKIQEALRRAAYHDELTGLPTYQTLVGYLRRGAFENLSHNTAFLFLIGIDRFKQVNQNYGHQIGDHILKQVANRLQGVSGEKCFAARVGGDNFALVISGAKDSLAAENLTQPTWPGLLELRRPYNLEGHTIRLNFRVCAAELSPEAPSSEALEQVNSAMSWARESGQSFVFCDAALLARLEQQKELEFALRTAMSNGELSLHFQPKIRMSGEQHGAEVLMRWNHPQLGDISPAVFIPIAEKLGLIITLSEWLVAEACARLKSWREDDFYFAGSLALNISSLHVKEPDFANDFLGQLSDAGIDPKLIEVELTESGLLEDSEHAITQLETLRAAGITIAIDDFGTGYSTLSYLGRLPIDVLKIDKTFIDDIFSEKGGQLVQAMIDISKALKMSVVAEGVEEQAQFDALMEMGCTGFQGYLIARPMSDEDFSKWMRHTPFNRKPAN